MRKIFILILTVTFLVACATKKETVNKTSELPQLPSVSSEGTKTTIQEGKTTTKWDTGMSEENVQQENLKEEDIKTESEKEIIQQNIENFSNRDVHFDFDDYKIKSDDIPYLETLALWLNEHAEYKITIEGHCDERGSDLYNLALGQKRANAVKDFLVTMGVDADRIDCISFGEEKPLDPGHNEEAWAKNRRCHFVISR